MSKQHDRHAKPARRKVPASSAHDVAHDRKGPCPLMRACGGCSWIGLPYRKQLTRKQAAMEELFSPLIDRMGWTTTIDPVQGMGAVAGATGPAPAPRAFRYKAATPFAPGPHGSVRAGFYARGTHNIVAVDECPVEAPGARAILNGVARVAERLGIPAYEEDTARGLLRYAVLRLGWKTNEGVLTVVTSQANLPHAEAFWDTVATLDPRVTCVAHNVNSRPGNAILGPETHVVRGNPRMRDQLLGCTFEISPTAFYQTNPEQTETLYRIAIEGMALEAGDTLLDAYCGSGTIGLAAAHAAVEAGLPISFVGVERNKAGIADAQRNAAINGLADRARFVAEDATAYLRRLAAEGGHVDVLALDPPRAGSTQAFLEATAALAPRRVVYISCNPTTQVRDLDVLGDAGYRLDRLTPVDMFPHTEHVETVAVLTR